MIFWAICIVVLAGSFLLDPSGRVVIQIAVLGGSVGYLYARIEQMASRIEALEKSRDPQIEKFEQFRSYVSERLTNLSSKGFD